MIDLPLDRGDEVIALVAQHVIGREDQAAAVDDHAGAVLIRDEARIGRPQRRGQLRGRPKASGRNSGRNISPARFLSHAGDSDDRFLAAGDDADEHLLHCRGGLDARRLLCAERCGKKCDYQQQEAGDSTR